MEQLEQLTSFIRSGEKGREGERLLGLEVEHFMVSEDGQPIRYAAPPGAIGARDVLAHLSDAFPECVRNASGDPLEVHGAKGVVSLEPASQLELSVAPFADVASVERAYVGFRKLVDPYLKGHGFVLDTSGYHPTQRAASLEVIPKERYAHMSAYFAQLESNGELMMRATASTHVSVDFADEADAVRKLRVASALAPVLAAIADNTHVFEGRRNHQPIRRFLLWREVDPRRCGTIPGVFSPRFGYDSYASWVLSASPIMDDTSQGDAGQILSFVWPDVRLKRVVEIRAADSMPADCTMGYVALIKGLLYSERSLRELEEALRVRNGSWTLANDDVDDAIACIHQWGHGALAYGKELRWWIELLFSCAHDALGPGEAAYLDPLHAFARDKPWWDVR